MYIYIIIYIYTSIIYLLQKYTCENKHIVNLAGDQTTCTNTQLSHYIYIYIVHTYIYIYINKHESI